MSELMACLGNRTLSDVIIFSVGESTMRLLDNLTRTNTVRFAQNDILGKKPCREYIGPDIDTLSFDIILKSWWGCKPREELDKLIYLQRDGTLLTFLVGGKAFGRYKWTITSLTERMKHIDNCGNIHQIDCSITMDEYLPRGY